MGKLLIILMFLLLSCNQLSSSSVEVVGQNEVEDIVYAQTDVGSFELSLIDSGGTCALSFKNLSRAKHQEATQLKFDMVSPCNFVRKPGKISEPLVFTYDTTEKRTVLVVVGGEPDKSRTDEFMPNGCGTELQAARIFDSRIEISRKINTGFLSTNCPSWGLDEHFFAGVAYREQ